MFNSQEQIAILKLLDSVIKADGFIHIKEAEFLEETITSLSIEMKNLKLIDNLSFEEALNTVKKMESDKKKIVLDCLSAVSESDNEVDKTEKALIEKIKTLIK